MVGNIGPLEIVVVLVVALIVFGPKRLPELGNSLGRSIREFKGSVTGESDGGNEKAKDISTATGATKASEPSPVTPETAQDDRS